MTESDSRETLRSNALDRVSDAIVGLNSDLEYTFANLRAEQIFDAAEKSLLGTHVLDSFPEVTNTVTEQELADAVETGQEQTFERYNETLDRWFEVRVYPDEDGVSVFFTDISERKEHEQVIEALPVAVGVNFLGESGQFEFVNQTAAELFDADSKEELKEHSPGDLYANPGERERFTSRLKEGETVDQREAEFTTLDGEDLWVEITAELTEIDGEQRIVSIVEDTSDRKQQERELPEKQERLRRLFDEAPDPMFVQDAEGKFTDVNEKAAERLGYSPEELLEMEAADIDAAVDRSDARELLSMAKSEGQTIEIEGRHQCADGSTYPVDVRVTPLETDGNDRFLSHARDISERKEREQKLERHRNVIQAVDDGVYALDETGHFELVNDAMSELTGHDTDELLGEHTNVIKSDEIVERAESAVRSMIFDERADDEATLELEVQRSDGGEFPAEDHMTLLWDDDGERFEGTAGIIRDITERKEREQELQRQNSRLNEFASVVSHDLRNPLNIAQARGTLLQQRVDAELQEHLAPLVTALERMENIIEDTLTLARQGETVGQMSSVSVTNLIDQCWAGVETSEAVLETDEEFTIWGDCDRLQHVFENLFRNAIEHGGEDVTVRVGRAGEDCIYVEDDGPGIPPGDRDSVFEPGHTSATGGTGFGLTIVKRIAEAHGWEITVTDGRDGGARFEFDTTGLID